MLTFKVVRSDTLTLRSNILRTMYSGWLRSTVRACDRGLPDRMASISLRCCFLALSHFALRSASTICHLVSIGSVAVARATAELMGACEDIELRAETDPAWSRLRLCTKSKKSRSISSSEGRGKWNSVGTRSGCAPLAVLDDWTVWCEAREWFEAAYEDACEPLRLAVVVECPLMVEYADDGGPGVERPVAAPGVECPELAEWPDMAEYVD